MKTANVVLVIHGDLKFNDHTAEAFINMTCGINVDGTDHGVGRVTAAAVTDTGRTITFTVEKSQ